MKKIQYAIARKETGNASGKAKKDAYDIALRLGFAPSYHPSNKQQIRVIQQIMTLPKFSGEKIIFFQYPAVSEPLMRMFKKFVSKKSYKIALVHDLSSIQGVEEYEIEKELVFLDIFDCLIVHNNRMKDFVKKMGYKGKIIILQLFDYLHDANYAISELPFSNTISFAGNLGKARFLKEIGRVHCNWMLYGLGWGVDDINISNITYKGLLPSDKIQNLMDGDYGLVWDGDSIETCTGPTGDYLRYNTPHKLSCYIAAGKPVITWNQAAIADFVEKHHIGLTLESLEKLNEIDLSYGYHEMKSNVINLKKELAKGTFLEEAINKALSMSDLAQGELR